MEAVVDCFEISNQRSEIELKLRIYVQILQMLSFGERANFPRYLKPSFDVFVHELYCTCRLFHFSPMCTVNALINAQGVNKF